MKRKADTLDLVVSFLQRRDGIDKVLKLIRYTAKLATVTVVCDPHSDLHTRLSSLEKSIGTSRKAYRLGKFLQDVSKLRKTPITTLHGLLEFVSNSGEGAYYFIEQFVWLVKAGVLPPRMATSLSKASAWAEAMGYVASITLNALRVAALLEREHALVSELCRMTKVTGAVSKEDAADILREVSVLRSRRTLRTLAIVQDCADMLLAVNDIKEGKGRLNHPVLLCIAGLVSGALSTQKNWKAIVEG